MRNKYKDPYFRRDPYDYFIWGFSGFTALFLVVILAYAIIFPIWDYNHIEHPTNCLVTNKDRTSNNGSSDMRIYTSCGNFVVQDSIKGWRMNSSDVYAAIQVGHRYNFMTRDHRIPWLSDFPNIFEYEEVK